MVRSCLYVIFKPPVPKAVVICSVWHWKLIFVCRRSQAQPTFRYYSVPSVVHEIAQLLGGRVAEDQPVVVGRNIVSRSPRNGHRDNANCSLPGSHTYYVRYIFTFRGYFHPKFDSAIFLAVVLNRYKCRSSVVENTTGGNRADFKQCSNVDACTVKCVGVIGAFKVVWKHSKGRHPISSHLFPFPLFYQVLTCTRFRSTSFGFKPSLTASYSPDLPVGHIDVQNTIRSF